MMLLVANLNFINQALSLFICVKEQVPLYVNHHTREVLM